MSVTAQRALRSAIDHRQFDRVYYLHGDDEYRKDEAIAQLVAAAVDPAARDFNFDTHRGDDVDAERLAIALTSLPLMAERRVVVLRDVGALKKAARAELDRYLRASATDTVLVLTSSAGDKPDAAVADRATSVAFPALTDDKLTTWLVQHARKSGLTLSAEAATLIAGAVGGDLTQAVGELDKLGSYTGGAPVSAADVEAIVGVRRGETMIDLLNAVAARDAARACALVGPVLAQPKTSGVQVVIFLSAQTLAMAWGRAVRDAGVSAARLESEFIGLLKSGGGYPGRPWGDAVKCWASNLPRWSRADLARAIDRLCAADLALKDTRVSSEEAIIASLVLSLCVDTPRPEAA